MLQNAYHDTHKFKTYRNLEHDISVFVRSEAHKHRKYLGWFNLRVFSINNPVAEFTSSYTETFIVQEDKNNYVFVGNYEVYRFKPIDDIKRYTLYITPASKLVPCAIDADDNTYLLDEHIYFQDPEYKQPFDYELIYPSACLHIGASEI